MIHIGKCVLAAFAEARVRRCAVVLTLATACGPSIETLELVGPEPRLLRARGQKVALQVVARDRSGAVITPPPLQWLSSAPEVVSVDGGEAVANRSGRALVQVFSGGARASTTFQVSIPAKMTARPQNVELSRVNSAAAVELTVWDDAGRLVRDAPVSWATSDPQIARVEEGRILGVGVGFARLTASAGEARAQVEVRVFQADLARISVQPVRHVFEQPGQSLRIRALGFNAKGAPLGEVPVVWAVSGSGVATVDELGVMTATGRGRALVSARAGRLRAAVEVQVR